MKRSIPILGLALFAALFMATAMQADSIVITYSFAGIGTVVSATDTTLTLDTEASGSILSTDSSLNILWNPINYSELCVLDLTTNLLQGNFTITLQDGDTLTGTDSEDDSIVDASPTGTGPFTQTLTFTGGTGEFAGAAGSVFGNGFLGTTDFTVSGSGTLDTAAVPEPASGALLVAGLAFIILGSFKRRNLLRRSISLVAFTALALPAFADDVVYVSNGSQLGKIDLSTGTYQQVGSDFTDDSQGLGVTANGRLVTLGFSGYLNSIDPATGVMTAIGPSGLSSCQASPCAANSVNTLATFNGQTYATDFANRLYRVDTVTGSASLIGITGMPAIPFTPLSMNTDGTLNVYDEAFFSADGKLYATFDAGYIDPSTGNPTATINGELYQIDPATGIAAPIGPTVFGLGAAVDVNGVTYAFLDGTQQIATLDLATGNTTVIGSFDPNAGIISAAVPTPESAAAELTTFGLGLIGLRMLLALRRATTT